MKFFTCKALCYVAYYALKSILGIPLVWIIYSYCLIKGEAKNELQTHFRWLFKSSLLSLPAWLLVVFWEMSIEAFGNLFLLVFGNNFISAMAGVGSGGIIILAVVISTFLGLRDGIAHGLLLLKEQKPYMPLKKIKGN
jgi:hypothetical protein